MALPADFLWPEEDLYPCDDDTCESSNIFMRDLNARYRNIWIDDDDWLQIICNAMRAIDA